MYDVVNVANVLRAYLHPLQGTSDSVSCGVSEILPSDSCRHGLPLPERVCPQRSCSKKCAAGCCQQLQGENFRCVHFQVSLLPVHHCFSSHYLSQIADFGMSRVVTSDPYYITSGGRIPVMWTAPEVKKITHIIIIMVRCMCLWYGVSVVLSCLATYRPCCRGSTVPAVMCGAME